SSALRANWTSACSLRSERRLDAVLLSRDAGSGQAAVRLLQRADENGGTRFQQSRVAGDVSVHLAFRPGDELGFGILELDLDGLPARGRRHPGDRGIGHRAVGPRIPRELALGQAALRLRENAQFDTMQLAVRALHPGRGDVVVRLDI